VRAAGINIAPGQGGRPPAVTVTVFSSGDVFLPGRDARGAREQPVSGGGSRERRGEVAALIVGELAQHRERQPAGRCRYR